jgi:hypothetical protein
LFLSTGVQTCCFERALGEKGNYWVDISCSSSIENGVLFYSLTDANHFNRLSVV